jgi:hypothetical protein
MMSLFFTKYIELYSIVSIIINKKNHDDVILIYLYFQEIPKEHETINQDHFNQ